ncbi:MAG: DUF945 domain-containing protein [Akkermansiaceae bacterium]|jgi:hypothetical protein|nr:DUF945 domain-containing protein [Akkermansiaceae bacterium]
MNNLIEPEKQPATQERPPGLLLHCGAQQVTRESISEVPTPPNTETWYPMSHDHLLNEVEEQLTNGGFKLGRQAHALSHDGARYFGLLELRLPGHQHCDYRWVVGLRNSHDKTFPAAMVAGTQVFVCDNLAFTGQVKLSRKHTRFAERDLRHLTSRAVGKLGDRFMKLDQRIDAYKQKRITDNKAHDLIVRALDCRAITATQVPKVLSEWRKPTHREFRRRNIWSLFNAVTETHKELNPHIAARRSEALHGLCDTTVGLAN